ncbi:hypothetical protein CHUAL_013761 [Chamberlinius hualienensis]
MNEGVYNWTAVVVTCCLSESTVAINAELELLRRKGVFSKETFILCVEDPELSVGSGGATLNALLMVVEHLSAKKGYNVLTANVLFDSRILVIHNGRTSTYAPCGKAFLEVPSSTSPFGYITNLELLVDKVNHLATACDNRYGLWVCSADWLLSGKMPSAFPTSLNKSSTDCLIFCCLGSEEEGVEHGVVEIDCDHSVTHLHYRQSVDVVRKCKLETHDGKVGLVLGIVYISPELAESLALLHSNLEIMSCTHLGVDSGSEPIQVSLNFDILAATASGVNEEQFVNGSYSECYDRYQQFRQSSSEKKKQFRRLVWKGLNQYRCKAVFLPNVDYVYLWDNLKMADYLTFLKKFAGNDVVIMNSNNNKVRQCGNLIMKNCNCKGQNVIVIAEKNVVASGLSMYSTELTPVYLKKNMAYLSLQCKEDLSTHSVFIFFGIYDDLFMSASDPNSTFCNRPWQDFYTVLCNKTDEIWSDPLNTDNCLFNASIFPIGVEVHEINEWVNSPKSFPSWWLTKKRVSINYILTHIDMNAEFNLRRERSIECAGYLCFRLLELAQEGTFSELFRVAVAEGWHNELLGKLDNLGNTIAKDDNELNKTCRVLASIADLLACIADGDGGVRSGPAGNKDWALALANFETRDCNHILRGLRMMEQVRKTWMTDPRRVIRASRHYEGAIQVLIRQNVVLAGRHITLRCETLPDMETWVTCECPARVDLFGGWTDTPPICYELGGSVINAAIRVNGKRPIGARIKRISDPVIVLHVDSGSQLKLTEKNQLFDYNQPLSQGALVKACICCTELVEMQGTESLKTQLLVKCQGGIEIEIWSDLPKGSGLGTSSILAACVLGCLWTISGKAYDRSSLIHAVLLVEQMLTTGGGWQDQVGGVTGGIVHGQSKNQHPLKVTFSRLQLKPAVLELFRNRLVLIYTGKVRLAKNLLQEVLRNWFAKDPTIYGTFHQLYNQSFEFAKSLEEGDLLRVGHFMNEYWRLKKVLAPGAEPPAVERVMKELQHCVYGQLLCGAGGGGFMIAIAKEGVTRKEIEEKFQQAQVVGMKIYDVDLDDDGITVTVGNQPLEIN